MKACLLFVLFIFTPNTFPQNVPHLFELRGLEDSLGNTHLFYRYGLDRGPSIIDCWSKNIYHFDIRNNIDTIYVFDQGNYYPFEGCIGIAYDDYDFFNSDPAKFICVGVDISVDPWVSILRYDGQVYLGESGYANEVEISNQDESLLYLVTNESSLFKSTDGGYNWTIDYDSLAYIDYAMISLSKNDDSHIYGIDNNMLVRSEDEGNSYIIVDDSEWKETSNLFYDPDGTHIYGSFYYSNYFSQERTSKLFVSNDNGNPFTWTNVLTYNLPIRFTHDEYIWGEVYYSFQKNIYKSTDYANTFEHYIRLDRNITGLYKKSGTDILYASTPLKIYEISSDTIHIIKSLPLPDEVLNYYPLAVGNKWVYDENTIIYDPYPHGSQRILVKEVIGDTIAPNGKHYYHIIDETLWESSVLERVDSSEGNVYRYYEDSTLTENEYLVDDLLAEVGDTVHSSRMGYYGGMAFTTILAEESFEKWGLAKTKKIYEQYSIHPPVYSLTQDIGLDSIHSFFDFFGDTWTVLKGCIIDGIVYGDTTVVSVEDQTQNLPTEFSLSQNYPNPFNPSTIISWQSPVGSWQTLKVYDVLGNKIATLVNEELPAGEYEVEFSAIGGPASGIYFYQLRAGSFVQTKKMILVR